MRRNKYEWQATRETMGQRHPTEIGEYAEKLTAEKACDKDAKATLKWITNSANSAYAYHPGKHYTMYVLTRVKIKRR